MIARALIAAAALTLSACNSQPGCTYENCKAALEGCRVEPGGGPSTLAVVTCTSFDRPDGGVDWARYCVDSCNNRPGTGAVIACIASKAGACRDGGITNLAKTIEPCLDKTATYPEKSCDDKCEATRKDCDLKCGIDRACDNCLRAGGNCRTICPDAGYQCLDCSAQCGRAHAFCQDSCPREP